MNKASLLLICSAGLLSGAIVSGCSPKMAPQTTTVANNANSYAPFTKLLKQRMEHENIDLKKVQFYVDQTLVLSRTVGSEKGTVNNGQVEFNNAQALNEVTIPAYTPGVLEHISGDSLFISFDQPGNTLVFSALYANEYFSLSSPSWYGGIASVKYDNQSYQVRCDGCGSAVNAHLAVKKAEQINPNKPSNVNRTIMGRNVK